jgi:invasion protein IalB
MTLKHVLIAGLAATAFMLPSYAALAQDTTPPAASDTPAASEPAAAGQDADQGDAAKRAPQQNWLKVCDPIDGGKKACIMRQVVLANGQFLGSFLLRDDPGQESRLLAVAAVPLGVLLPFGLTWQIDGGKPIRVPFMLCDPQSCATQLVINEAYVNSLKKGATLKLTAKNRQNKDLTVNINLAGFTAVYDGEAALTFDEFRKEQTGSAALEQQLQDRAEQLRKELDSGQTPNDAGTTEQTTPVPPTAPPAEQPAGQ